MDASKALEVIALYRRDLKEAGIKKADFPHNITPPRGNESLAHVLSALDKMEGFIREGQTNKFSRWLGFVQGVLWTTGIYCIDELKDHNRSAE